MFVFIKRPEKDNDFDKETVTVEVNASDISWPDLVEKFIQFLRGCGYSITDEDLKGFFSDD